MGLAFGLVIMQWGAGEDKSLESMILLFESSNDEHLIMLANYYHELKEAGKDPLDYDPFLLFKTLLAEIGFDLR